MQTYRMLITTQDNKGRWNTERVSHLIESELEDRRAAVRAGMPVGSVFKVKVVAE